MLANLVAFIVIAGGLIGYGVVDLLGNPFQHQTHVSATFPNAAGVADNFGVVLKGVVVGSVSSVQLTHQGAKVVITLEQGTKVPDNVVASIGLANDLGEQQVQLTPSHRSAHGFLHNGEVIPVRRHDTVPVEVGKVIGTASRLLKSIGARQLNTVLRTLGQGLQGESTNLQSMMVSSQQFSREFLTYQHQFESLLANSTPVMNGLARDGLTLRRDLAATEVLANVLDTHRFNLVKMLSNGALAARLANRLTEANRPNLACIIHDFAAVSANGSEPANLANLSVGLATNHWFFGAVEHISPTGPAKSLFPGDPYNAHQEWLRTRLFFPPGSPPANEYARPSRLGPVLPGAGCNTEFGKGVGPAHQSLAQFPVAGTRYQYPTRSESVVRGGGDPHRAHTTSYSSPMAHPRYTLTAARGSSRPAGALAWMALLCAAGVGLIVLAPRRRRYQRVPVTVRARTRRDEES